MRGGFLLVILCGCGATAAGPVPPAPEPEPFEPPPMYEALFDEGAAFTYAVIIIGEEDDTGERMECRVGNVRHTPATVTARLHCRGVGWDGPYELSVPAEVSPAGVYVATTNGLFRRDSDEVLSDDELGLLTSRALVMPPRGEERTILDTAAHTLAIYRSEDKPGWWCRHESFGGSWPDDGQSSALCFRPGAGLVGGGYTMSRGGTLYRGHYQLAEVTLGARGLPDDAPDAQAIVINEVSAAPDPNQILPAGGVSDDWFEIVNVSAKTVQLDDFVYSDRPDDFARVVAFPTMTLAPGVHYVQRATDDESGFRLNGSESLAVYRGADHALSDTVAWEEGESPPGGSYARLPDLTGAFTTVAIPTPGRANRK